MSTTPTIVTLRVPRFAVLFAPEPFDPSRPEPWSVGALDALVETCQSRGSLTATHLRVLLAENDEEDSAFLARAGNVVRIFCQRRASENLRAASALRSAGWRSLRRGLIALAISLTLAATITHWQPLPPLINRMVSEGLHIIGWVTLWHPVELLLYECAPRLRASRFYDELTRLHLEFCRDPYASGP